MFNCLSSEQRVRLIRRGRSGICTAYLKELIHRRPRVWVHDGDRLHQEGEDTGTASCP
jgi:hypothetical protein